jgi:hypothetical protein
MTGPEHYRAAERLLAGRTFPADVELHIEERHTPPTAEDIAAAQVHATLALAATTALTAPVCSDTEDGSGHATKADYDAWVAVAGGTSEGGGSRD